MDSKQLGAKWNVDIPELGLKTNTDHLDTIDLFEAMRTGQLAWIDPDGTIHDINQITYLSAGKTYTVHNINDVIEILDEENEVVHKVLLEKANSL